MAVPARRRGRGSGRPRRVTGTGRSRLGTAVAAALLAVAAAGVAGCSGGTGSSAGANTGSADATGSTAGAQQLQQAYEHTVSTVLPSVVQITAGQELGSGVVYDSKGDIVTNAHVVGTNKTFSVTLADKSAALAATLVASYPPNDLAVIRLTDPPSGLKPASFAGSGSAQVGKIVLAMGSPLGLSSSVTQGIVSAVGRTVSESADAESGAGGTTIPDMVQTSAAINPGNSGGALVGLDDQVVGIPTLAAVDPRLGSAAQGIGFAIPASAVTRLADQMIEHGKVVDSGRAALNVTTRSVLGNGMQPVGAGIVEVSSGGAAAKAGLRAGDVITKIDDTDITGSDALSTVLAGKKPGDKVTVSYLRDDATHTVDVTLGTL